MNMLPALPKVSPIIKPASARCNIACTYCYYKTTHSSKANGWLMGEEVLTRVITDIIKIAKSNGTVAEFTWHGGEPTLAGLDFYRRAVDIQKREAKSDVEVSNNIQTNATLLDEEWAKFLKENNFSVGVSVDGPKWLHDKVRIHRQGRGSFDKVMRGVGLLQDYEIPFGVIAVVTHYSIGHARDIIDFFVRNGILSFDLSPCAELPGNEGTSLTINPVSYADFMIDSFDYWLELDNPSITIRFLQQALQGLMGKEPGLCSMSRNYCGIFPTITPDGSVFFCDNYEGSEDMLLGSVLSHSISDLIFNQSRHRNIRLQIIQAKQRCKLCEWYDACGGGCPRYNRLGKGQSFSLDNYFCAAYKKIIGHIARRVNDVVESVLTE